MIQYIISLEFLFNGLDVHILVLKPFGEVRTYLVPIINSPRKLKKIRQMIESNRIGELAEWFENEYSLCHSKITISFGPEIRKWLIEKRKEKKKNGI